MPAASAAAVPADRTIEAGESRTSLVRRARRINRTLAETYPGARCELDFSSPFELLIATVLSAQTTDKRVNAISPALFARYPGPAELAASQREHVEQIIAPTGFFRAKTDSIRKLSADLLERLTRWCPTASRIS